LIPSLAESDYEKDEKAKTVTFTESGVEHIEALLTEHGLLESGGLYDAQNISLVHHVNQALRAHKLFARDTDYIVKDGKVVIIDEFTGRMMDGRRYSEGLHQALEAKEHVDIQNENQTLASITFQNYFRLYPKLAGMTGTALTEASEFMDIYNLGVVEVPTNVPVARIDHNDKIYKSIADKEVAIISLIKECHERKQPVLVGTVSIDKSEMLSARLKKEKIPHQVLNARYHETEAGIIAQAGRPGAVTIATNMAGRGTDIQLGGNFDMRCHEDIPTDAPEEIRKKLEEKIRQEIEADKAIVLEAGGLYVVGTERHESRRIDNQLRGRSGRQGDPGASIFFLSTQDDLLRIFAGNTLEALLTNDKIGLKDGEALAHPLLSRRLEAAQRRVEQHHYEIRKNLLKFDNVMNDQRKVIYEQRHEIMEMQTVTEMVDEMRHDIIREQVAVAIPPNAYAEQWNVESLKHELHSMLGLDLPIEDWAKEEGIADEEIVDRVIEASDSKMAEKRAQAGDDFFNHIEKSFVLRLLDQNWKEHLLHLDHLRQGINLRAFAQRDPLNEYKSEAFNMFEAMMGRLRHSIVQQLSIIEINIDEQTYKKMIEQQRAKAEEQARLTRNDPALDDDSSSAQPASGNNTVQFRKRFDQNDSSTWDGNVPRNAPCPCASGKKFKYCHGKI